MKEIYEKTNDLLTNLSEKVEDKKTDETDLDEKELALLQKIYKDKKKVFDSLKWKSLQKY